MGSAGPAPLHVVEFGLAWPPDTFLRTKLAGLAQRGFRITVVASSGESAELRLPGVEVVRMPARTEPLAQMLLGAARDCLRLGIRQPDRLAAVRAASAHLRRGRLRERLRLLRLLAAMAPLRPDVVHFEWESAALKYLPLVDLWRCPMVMSCHGGLGLYSQSHKHSKAVAGVTEAFRRAAAVHCVSDAVRAEATRYGLDPGKAQVIRCGVDLGVFAPSQR
jgi:glycosyltransferase involved in cell wall biosynthesis